MLENGMPANKHLNELIFNSYDHFLNLIYEKYERVHDANGFVFRDFIAYIRQNIMNHGKEQDIHEFIQFQNQASELKPHDFFDLLVAKMHEAQFEPKNWHSQSEPLYTQVIEKLESMKQDSSYQKGMSY